MRDSSLLGPWVRRFLLEHLVGERNLARNTQMSYRDTLRLLLPNVARRTNKPIDRLSVTDLSADRVRQFLRELEETRGCAIATRNQRLAAIHALARFIGLHAPELVEWCGQVRGVPFKKAQRALVTLPGEGGDGCRARGARPDNRAGPARPCLAAVLVQHRGAGG